MYLLNAVTKNDIDLVYCEEKYTKMKMKKKELSFQKKSDFDLKKRVWLCFWSDFCCRNMV